MRLVAQTDSLRVEGYTWSGGRRYLENEITTVCEGAAEFMPEAEFKRRYGGIGAPAYKSMMNDIERRVATLPLYR